MRFQFSRRLPRKLLSSGICRRVLWYKYTDISEDPVGYIPRVDNKRYEVHTEVLLEI